MLCVRACEWEEAGSRQAYICLSISPGLSFEQFYQLPRNLAVLSFNLLKTKRNLLYVRNQSVPRRKLSATVIKTKQLITYKAKVAVCSDIRTKHSTQSEHHVEFLNVKPCGT